MTLAIRDERYGDRTTVRQIVLGAFGRSAEADLVDALRQECDSIISLLAINNEEPAGHVQFSRMIAPADALGLGPVSVFPSHQNHGIGAALIWAGLNKARQMGWACVIVLGEPAYSNRFGFRAELAATLNSEYSGPYLQGLALHGTFPTAGDIIYAPAFSRLT